MRTPRANGAKIPPGRKVQHDPDYVMPAQEHFVLAYLGNGFNGTRAYLEAHPEATYGTAAVEAHRLLKLPKIRKALEDALRESFARVHMNADEALARISTIARANLRDAYDDNGKLLPLSSWPDSLLACVKSIKQGEHGDTVTLHDSLRAQELMAQAGGKLKAGSLVLTFDHAKYLGAAPPEE